MHDWMGAWHVGWMIVWWLAVAVVVAAVLWTALRGLRPEPETPEQILKRRYARGEIDREEYERRLSDLRK